ncbi:hypothetical protein [Actinomadura sp. DC4]|uniref:hypothetical protein n=1 Tax=Actinomadura sp. DC4 TaxID=3055069 RepID=UPI0025B1F1ED|nr:hypothetical protein [Actinomadura sp. DC4]MDN3358906.1 hypothetical protein [Actinomadura sp. DC4]
MGYTVDPASLRRYDDDVLTPHLQALRDLKKSDAGRPVPPLPQGLAADGTAGLFTRVGDQLGYTLDEAVRHATAGQAKVAETARRYADAETANTAYFTDARQGIAATTAGDDLQPSRPVAGGDGQDLTALLRSAIDRLCSVVAPLGGLPLVRPVTEQLWANAVDPRHYDTAASAHAAHTRHLTDLRSRLDASARTTLLWDGSARDGFETDRNRHLATLDDAEAHSRRLATGYGEMAVTMREFLSHAALAIAAFLAAFSVTLFVSHFLESALFLCLAEIAAFMLYLAGWLSVRLVSMAQTVRKTLSA